MRHYPLCLLLLGQLALCGCASQSDPAGALTLLPSEERTGSIAAEKGARPKGLSAPVPAGDVGAAPQRQAAALPAIPASSSAGSSSPASSSSAPSSPASPAMVPPSAVGASRPPRDMLSFAGAAPSGKAFSALPAPGNFARPAPRPEPGRLDPPRATPAVLPVNPQHDGPAAGRSRSQIYSQRFRDAKPINFGKHSPRQLAVHGVDVSRWQGEIDWPKLRSQGANFAYIKATDGGDHIDPKFRDNWRGAKAAGIRRGAYHFFYWCRTAGEQADWFIRNVPREADALPPVIDVEYNHLSDCKMRLSRAKVIEKMRVFMDKLERHYGKRPVIYTAPDFYADNLDGAFQNYPFWLRAVAAHPSKVYPGRRWLFWQYSGSGLSHGVSEKIDLNVFNGNGEDWHRFIERM